MFKLTINENLFNRYLIKIKTLIIVIKRFSIKLIIPKGVFAYPPIHAQFNFNLSKYTALNTEIIPESPKIMAKKIIKAGGEELRKLIPINN